MIEKTVDRYFKELLGNLHKSVLKTRGFKKTGGNFRQYLPDGIYKIINFQKSQFNSDGECRFTINLGIYLEKNPENPNLQFKEYQCQIRTRVSGVSKRYSGDQWWDITENSDCGKIFEELAVVLEEDILPWLDQFSSRQAVFRLGQSGVLKNMIWGSLYNI